ncbi:S41 family peptidase [Brevundimonas sp.]|uniref:S41 family peptidase n=1 Tax=Brevundimonas sp. TaxID=1871086 RepID=UPI0025BF25F0|nr:S41 family peptidase [Brevundimonas sp.]
MDRRFLLKAGFSAVVGSAISGAALADEPVRDIRAISDFDELWSTLDRQYCFFAEKRTDWNRVREVYRPMAQAAQTYEELVEIVRRVLAELYDPHTSMSGLPDGSQRGPISDLIAEWRNGQARISAISDDSVAAQAGLAIGDVILSVGGRPVEAVMRELMPQCLTAPDPEATAYALNSALAGLRGQDRRYQVSRGRAAPREVILINQPRPARPNVEWRRLDDGAGYIAIRSFEDDAVTERFDQALVELRDAPGLIVDARYNGGGDTAVARPIMGRFITETKPYAMMRRREGSGLGGFWTETVDPRGPFTYTRPVVVLANHWSGSMAEGFPMGMRGIGRATVVGTPMMGLGAAVFPVVLDRTGIRAQYSAEPVYDVNRQPRWLMQPDVAVPDGQDILAAGQRTLASLIG